MTITAPSRRQRPSLPYSDTIEVNIEVTTFGEPDNPLPIIDLAIAVDMAMGPFPPPPPPPPLPPPPPGVAPMVPVVGLGPLLEDADDENHIVVLGPIVEQQGEELNYDLHQQQHHQQELPLPLPPPLPPLLSQQPQLASTSSSATVTTEGAPAIDSAIPKSAVPATAAVTLSRRSSRKTKSPPPCTSCFQSKCTSISTTSTTTTSTSAAVMATVTQHSISLRRTRSAGSSISPPHTPQRRRSLRLLNRQAIDSHLGS